MSDHGGYIAGLDGLRALAVLAVVIYHVSPAILAGGYLGVDVFFVISGFLITTLILREKRKTGGFDLRGFWVRRARRLFPAFVVLILTVVPLAWAINRDLLVGIGRQVLGALTFSTNWLEIAHGTSYFDQTSPLLFKNFWSLAIEEQFYLFWPLVMLALLTVLAKLWQRLAIAAILAGGSALLMAVLYDPANVTFVYYGTHTHMFGIALGIVLAFIWADPREPFLGSATWRAMNQPVGAGALAVIAVAMIVLPDDAEGAYRGVIALVSSLTVVVIAAMLAPGSLLARLADNRVFRWVGSRSYGLYLWHWPILVMVTALVPAAIGTAAYWIRAAIAVALTALICEVSYRFVETPVRKFGFRRVFDALKTEVSASRAGKIAAGVVGLLLALTLLAITFAPAKSSTTLQIEAGEAEPVHAEASSSAAPSASAAPASTEQGAATRAQREKLPTKFDTSVPATDDITAIGDSMIAASKGGFVHAMPGIRFVAKSNMQWKDAARMVRQGLAANQIGRGVIITYGTNAGVPDTEKVREVMDLLGPDRMIVLVNLYSPSTFVSASNKELAKVAKEYANVTLLDWNAYVSGKPALLQVDQTHPSMKGALEFGQLAYRTLKDFSAQLSSQGSTDKNEETKR